MKRNWRGFTLIEVSLFLAITTAVFVAIAVGTQNSIFQQRYSDAVQNFAEFLRTTYSQVSNVQSEGTGRTDTAIYGKLVVFGEENGKNEIISYNVIGGIGEASGDNVLAKLASLGANILSSDGDPVGIVESYTPRWASQIQTTSGWNNRYQVFTGALLIVRHPSSGTIYTYSMAGNGLYEAIKDNSNKNPLNSFLNGGNFTKEDDVDFCVNPNGTDRSSLRRDVRIVAGARNASGVEIISDEEDMVNGKNIGDRCEL